MTDLLGEDGKTGFYCGFRCACTSMIGGPMVADSGWAIIARSIESYASGSTIRRPLRCYWRSADIFRPSRRSVQRTRGLWGESVTLMRVARGTERDG